LRAGGKSDMTVLKETKLRISDEFLLTVDKYQWIINQRIDTKDGSVKWKAISYHPQLVDAVERCIHMELSTEEEITLAGIRDVWKGYYEAVNRLIEEHSIANRALDQG